MKIQVRLFARARDLAGGESVELELGDNPRVADLRTALLEQCPALEPLARSLLIAVDNDYASNDRLLEPSAEIACFPPVSGG